MVALVFAAGVLAGVGIETDAWRTVEFEELPTMTALAGRLSELVLELFAQ